MRSFTPRVTITIPTRNRAHLLPGVIRSVLGGSFADFELFVSDNASTDGTRDVVASFDDPRIHYVRNEVNIGVHANLSRGFELGAGRYVGILPDDDLSQPDNLARKVDVLERNQDVDWIHSAFKRILVTPDGSELVQENVNWVGGGVDHIEPGPVVLRRLLTERYWIPYSGTLFRREVVRGERFDPEDRQADDVGVALRVASRARAIAFVAEPLVVTRFHPDAYSSRAGTVEFASGSYRSSFDGLRHIKRAKDRFLARQGSEMQDLRAVRAGSDRWLRRELLDRVLERAGPNRRMSVALRALGEAARVDPTVLLSPTSARLVVSCALGPAGRAAARRVIREWAVRGEVNP